MKIAFYVSSHGFGHISRCSSLIEYLIQENHEVVLMTLRKNFFQVIPDKLVIRVIATDLGVEQKNSLEVDISKTLEKLLESEKNKKLIIEKELDFLNEFKPDILVSDSSSMPFLFSSKLKIRSYFLGNFTWDFIYENYSKLHPEFLRISRSLKNEYSLADYALILPFSCPINVFKNTKIVGVLGRKPNNDKKTLREKFQFDEGMIYYLFSFGAYGLEFQNFQLENLNEKERIVVSRLEALDHEKVIRIDDAHYPDLVSACDYVVTKPGYGILSECFFGKTPILFTDRGDFAEYPFLVNAIENHLIGSYISNEELFQLNLQEAIQRIPKNWMPKVQISSFGLEEIYSFFLNPSLI
ncbi:MAG: glycosyltransferase family protein [Leptospiraceae bacterium]|nr:glycosyltransferase family protein [Leptospiraceae bacterium]